ncbi:MAG: Gfo/Idh/MocA family oxidoreductase, partial [Planctomycetes bacterium]|nr:Gfo/Idh/MocA family oxidoreductase [Planctomycetota bacterium]
MTRRTFVKNTGAGMAVAPLIMSRVWAHMPPADTIRHAVIGTGKRGGGHAREFQAIQGCEVVAVCDVDPENLKKAAKNASPNVKTYTDFRKLLKDSSIDSVTIATPDHWHTPVALAALMAGKHVYIEKPCSHNIYEASLLKKAAKEFGKCVQHGTQRRSDGDHIEGIRLLREGVIGDVHVHKAINHQHRGKIGTAKPEQPPKGVNYDMWLGAAPKVSFTKNRWHYDWHWFWDYGGGDVVNDGIHQIDVAIWAMGDRYPNRVVSTGGMFYYDDDHETPDTLMALFDYDDGQIIFEQRLYTDYKLEGHDNGNVSYGTKGRMEFGRSGVIVYPNKGDSYKVESPKPVENI